MRPGIAVVVVTHDTREHTVALLQCLAADPASAGWEHIVIDNDSSDGTERTVRELYPFVRLVRNAPQRGYAAALNQAIAASTAPCIVAVNPDTRVPAGTLERLRSVLESDEKVGAVAPLVRLSDGRRQRQGLFAPRPYTALVVLTGLQRLPGFRREAERYYGDLLDGPLADVEILPGTCLMLRRAALAAVGPFDERFFVYCEDVDWCLRARAAGWRLVLARDVEIVHDKSASSRAHSTRVIRIYYRSVRAFYAKHHAPRTPVPIRGLWYAGAYAKEGVALLANALRSRKGLRY